jgi:aldehyde dehydrogenase (NAD+)
VRLPVEGAGAGGGIKTSGHGREKGLEAPYAFSTLKTVTIKHG